MELNYNLLYGKNFLFVVDRLPTVAYFCQQATIPSISVGTATYPTPFTKVPVHGDLIEYSPFTIEFNVDEDLRNYEELLSWMQSYGTPNDFDQYIQKSSVIPKTAHAEQYSDASLITSTNKDNPNIEFRFETLFPTELGDLQMSITDDNIPVIKCSATFHYTKFVLKRWFLSILRVSWQDSQLGVPWI